MRNKAIKSIFTLSACALAINAATAQEQVTLEVIQVTAQKRSENAQETPISMNVLSAEDIKEKISNIPSQFKSLPHQVAAKNIVMYIAGLWVHQQCGLPN